MLQRCEADMLEHGCSLIVALSPKAEKEVERLQELSPPPLTSESESIKPRYSCTARVGCDHEAVKQFTDLRPLCSAGFDRLADALLGRSVQVVGHIPLHQFERPPD